MTSVTIDRTDGLNSAAAIKGPCRVATTANIAISGLQTIDDVVLASGDRVLVKDQASGSENGIYVADTGPWRRSKDFNRTRDVVKGTFVLVTDGTANGGYEFVVTTENPIAVGITSVTFELSGSAPLPTQGRVYNSVSEAEDDYIWPFIKRIETQFYAPLYAEPATLTGGSHYRRVHKDDTDMYPTRAWFRSADRFLPGDDETVDSVNGGYWFIDEVEPNVRQFGAVGDGRDDTDAIHAARNFLAVQSGLGDALQKLRFQAGTYAYSTSPNWAVPYAEIVADGKVILKHTGSGQALIIDSGAYPASGVLDMKMRGFIVEGNVNTTIGAYVRAVHHSEIEINIRCGTTFALYAEFCVCTVFPNLIISNNHGPWTSGTYPATGVFLNRRSANEEMSYCLFLNPIIEGCGIGVEASWALGCTFIGGTIEGNYEAGLRIYENSRCLKLFSVDFEFNNRINESTADPGDDIICQGYQNEVIACNGDGRVLISNGAEDNIVTKGSFNLIAIESGALRTQLEGVGYNRFGDGSLVVSDTSTRMRGLRNLAGEYVHDAIPANTAITVGASPWAYTNTTANPCTLTLSGGTISYFGFRNNLPSGVAEFGVTRIPSVFRLEPNQGINIIYTDVPTINRHDF